MKERLPKDIEARKKAVHDLQRVVAEPAMGQSDLDELQNKVNKYTLFYFHVFFNQGNFVFKASVIIFLLLKLEKQYCKLPLRNFLFCRYNLYSIN